MEPIQIPLKEKYTRNQIVKSDWTRRVQSGSKSGEKRLRNSARAPKRLRIHLT